MDFDTVKNGLFYLTQVTNAIRFFKGDFKIDDPRNNWDIPSYYGVLLNPALGNTVAPIPLPGNPMVHNVTVYNEEGLPVFNYHQFIGDNITEARANEWWGYIRPYVMDEDTIFPRMAALRKSHDPIIAYLEARSSTE